MAAWALLIIVLPVAIGLSLIAGLRRAVRGLVVRHPLLAARTFLSVAVALYLAWLFGVPIDWAIAVVRG